jgi:hypothetical protein
MLWLILAEALENGHDAAGAELVHERTEAGSVRALRLRWRSRMRQAGPPRRRSCISTPRSGRNLSSPHSPSKSLISLS